MATNTVKRSDRARARVQAVRAAGERRFEETRQRTRWLPLLIESFEREQRSGAALLAGGLAYRLFFWLVSFGLVVAAAASFWERYLVGPEAGPDPQGFLTELNRPLASVKGREPGR